MPRPILEVAARYFADDSWPAEPVEEAPAFRIPFGGSDEDWTCLAIAREEARQFVFYSALEGLVPQESRPMVQEYLTRANWGMAIGNWEMDPNTGEVRYKTSIDVGDDDLTVELVKRLVHANIRMVERYLPGLRDVIAGQLVPAAAVQRAEEG